ncbi:V-type proton ATPase catalytic subunit A [Chamberlinius hualienensis]
MASQTQGIQQLIAAEKRAADKVAEARKRKARRLKQAKEEAQAEIEKYKQEREAQFRDHEAKYMGSKDDIAAKIETDKKNRLEEMDRSVGNNKEKVIDQILSLVYNIKPEAHYNLRIGVRNVLTKQNSKVFRVTGIPKYTVLIEILVTTMSLSSSLQCSLVILSLFIFSNEAKRYLSVESNLIKKHNFVFEEVGRYFVPTRQHCSIMCIGNSSCDAFTFQSQSCVTKHKRGDGGPMVYESKNRGTFLIKRPEVTSTTEQLITNTMTSPTNLPTITSRNEISNGSTQSDSNNLALSLTTLTPGKYTIGNDNQTTEVEAERESPNVLQSTESAISYNNSSSGTLDKDSTDSIRSSTEHESETEITSIDISNQTTVATLSDSDNPTTAIATKSQQNNALENISSSYASAANSENTSNFDETTEFTSQITTKFWSMAQSTEKPTTLTNATFSSSTGKESNSTDISDSTPTNDINSDSTLPTDSSSSISKNTTLITATTLIQSTTLNDSTILDDTSIITNSTDLTILETSTAMGSTSMVATDTSSVSVTTFLDNISQSNSRSTSPGTRSINSEPNGTNIPYELTHSLETLSTNAEDLSTSVYSTEEAGTTQTRAQPTTSGKPMLPTAAANNVASTQTTNSKESQSISSTDESTINTTSTDITTTTKLTTQTSATEQKAQIAATDSTSQNINTTIAPTTQTTVATQSRTQAAAIEPLSQTAKSESTSQTISTTEALTSTVSTTSSPITTAPSTDETASAMNYPSTCKYLFFTIDGQVCCGDFNVIHCNFTSQALTPPINDLSVQAAFFVDSAMILMIGDRNWTYYTFTDNGTFIAGVQNKKYISLFPPEIVDPIFATTIKQTSIIRTKTGTIRCYDSKSFLYGKPNQTVSDKTDDKGCQSKAFNTSSVFSNATWTLTDGTQLYVQLNDKSTLQCMLPLKS